MSGHRADLIVEVTAVSGQPLSSGCFDRHVIKACAYSSFDFEHIE